jgi:hypothetical protein
MKEEIRKLNPIVIEIAEELNEFERFVGISAAFDDNGVAVFVGLVEKYNSDLELIGKRYVRIQARHLEPTDDTFTVKDMKLAFEQGRSTTEVFESWFDFFIKRK